MKMILIRGEAHYENSQNGINVVEGHEIIIGWYFTWDEWGRAKLDCAGGGLCNFRLVKISIEVGYSVPVEEDDKGNIWVDVPISEDMPEEYNYDYFPIDEDISYTIKDGKTYTVQKGLYPLNNTIGKNGGYRLPLIGEIEL